MQPVCDIKRDMNLMHACINNNRRTVSRAATRSTESSDVDRCPAVRTNVATCHRTHIIVITASQCAAASHACACTNRLASGVSLPYCGTSCVSTSGCLALSVKYSAVNRCVMCESDCDGDTTNNHAYTQFNSSLFIASLRIRTSSLHTHALLNSRCTHTPHSLPLLRSLLSPLLPHSHCLS